jgi:PAS domain S-box-containing protein
MRTARPALDKPRPPLSAGTTADTLLSREFLETFPDAIVAVRADGIILQVNAQTEELFGYAHGELIGQKIEVLVPDRFRGQHHGHRDSYAASPKTRRMGAGLDLKGRRRNGSEFDVEISLSPVQTEEGVMVLSAIRDTSDRKRIEEELRRAHEELNRRTTQQIGEYRARLASIIDSSEDAIIGKDLDGTITAWNRGAQKMYGYSPDEVIGKNISLLTPRDRPDEIPEILQRIRQGEFITHYESIRVTKDGRRLDVSISIAPIRDVSGNIIGASAIARDFTEQKRAEEHLRQAQKMEAVGRLAGGLAHDFNNILGIITACTELLRGSGEVVESSPYIANIRKAVVRGTSLTRQLLAFTRKSAVQVQLIDLNSQLKDVSKLIRPLMGDDVEIRVQPHCASAIVEIDPGQFDQIVLNLAVNSRDAMPRGGKFILETTLLDLDDVFTEQHRPMQPGRYVGLAVSDNGTGMDQTTTSRIFEPFFTTKEVGRGTGLGLATVYGIVQQSGGHIWVYSEPGRGTTFRIYFRSAEEKLGEQTESVNEPLARRRDGTTILVVEDDEIMLGLTRQLLIENGYTVLQARDGSTALDIVRSQREPIHLLLTDVVMRGMSGPQLVAEVKASHPGVKPVFMSGYTGELIAQDQPDVSSIPLLEKPFTRAALYKILDTTLG